MRWAFWKRDGVAYQPSGVRSRRNGVRNGVTESWRDIPVDQLDEEEAELAEYDWFTEFAWPRERTKALWAKDAELAGREFSIHKPGFGKLGPSGQFPTESLIHELYGLTHGGGLYQVKDYKGHLLREYRLPGEPRGYTNSLPPEVRPQPRTISTLRKQLEHVAVEQLETQLAQDPALADRVSRQFLDQMLGVKGPKDMDPFEAEALKVMQENPQYRERMVRRALEKRGLQLDDDEDPMDRLIKNREKENRLLKAYGVDPDADRRRDRPRDVQSAAAEVLVETIQGLVEAMKSGELRETIAAFRQAPLQPTLPPGPVAGQLPPGQYQQPQYQPARPQYRQPATPAPIPAQSAPVSIPVPDPTPSNDGVATEDLPAGIASDMDWLALLKDADWEELAEWMHTLSPADFVGTAYQVLATDPEDYAVQVLMDFLRLNEPAQANMAFAQARQIVGMEIVRKLALMERGQKAYDLAVGILDALLTDDGRQWVEAVHQAAVAIYAGVEQAQAGQGQAGQEQAVQQQQVQEQAVQEPAPELGEVIPNPLAGDDEDRIV